EDGNDLAVGEAGCLHGTSSEKGTRKFHFWRQLTCGGITIPVDGGNVRVMCDGSYRLLLEIAGILPRDDLYEIRHRGTAKKTGSG
ncbi:hypothetical protein J7440_15585, partial [Xanthomonas phaseoli pv. dieffenbachiae]|uniref:hypothetical protein n=1 Tax=Xanthomonas phaseoli TaxID=1985254 RepID=UPI001AD965D2